MSKKVVYIALQQFCEQTDRPKKILQEAGLDVRLNTLGRRLKVEEMGDILREADAVVAGVEPYNAGLLDALPKLRCISRCGIGTDAIDLSATKQKGIAVMTTIDEIVEPVAQMTVAMILGLARNIPQHLTESHAGRWTKYTGRLLSEWTLGFIGFGRIARAVERYLRPFGCRLLISDPHLKDGDVPAGAVLCNQTELLKQADLVSLHAARHPNEGPLIGTAEISQMKPGSYLVNTARGYMVDEKALFNALVSKQLAGAALDVFEEEPYQGPLAKLPNVICTPHVATLTHSSRAAMELRAAQNVAEFFNKGAL